MIVFDVDGTLIGGESIDWSSFNAAFEEVAGFALTSSFFAGIEEVTAQAIVHQALAALPIEEREAKEQAVCLGYLRRLQEAHASDPGCFPALEGALLLMQELRERGMAFAIATGDWRESISFKLRAAGFSIEDIPLVTSSEFYSRADIIAAAVAKAGRSLDEAVYVGDGLWDLRACRNLGIPFIGTGHRHEKLRDAGAAHVLLDLSPPGFWRLRETMNEAQVTVTEADLSRPDHQAATAQLLNAYAMDPMGDGKPLSEAARRDLIPGLREHPTTMVFLADRGSEPVGLAICFRGFSTFAARPLVNVSDFYVVPALRGAGIGRQLLAAIEQRAREIGCCRLSLEVQENNHRAKAVYAAAGFAQAVYVPEAGGVLCLYKSF